MDPIYSSQCTALILGYLCRPIRILNARGNTTGTGVQTTIWTNTESLRHAIVNMPNHWGALAIDFKSRTIAFGDSMNLNAPKNVIDAVFQWLEKRLGRRELQKWNRHVSRLSVKKQTDGGSCGVLAAMAIEFDINHCNGCSCPKSSEQAWVSWLSNINYHRVYYLKSLSGLSETIEMAPAESTNQGTTPGKHSQTATPSEINRYWDEDNEEIEQDNSYPDLGKDLKDMDNDEAEIRRFIDGEEDRAIDNDSDDLSVPHGSRAPDDSSDSDGSSTEKRAAAANHRQPADDDEASGDDEASDDDEGSDSDYFEAEGWRPTLKYKFSSLGDARAMIGTYAAKIEFKSSSYAPFKGHTNHGRLRTQPDGTTSRHRCGAIARVRQDEDEASPPERNLTWKFNESPPVATRDPQCPPMMATVNPSEDEANPPKGALPMMTKVTCRNPNHGPSLVLSLVLSLALSLALVLVIRQLPLQLFPN
ncbi:MAG: hypothetical protein J3Q66DRAFT_444988 [Benniella sp.]|nr:MAG: hypothetical protein J3Q66DRAFT_445588 [Benniella sp.]KAK3807193.1 MAG: hypothetical protein J3Q66DRAFT_444988 [Benniella sp.]